MEFLIYTFVFVFGIIIGSFLNVCIYRIPAGLSIVKPPSRCPSCETKLKPLDLVPVLSWIFLKGRCRYCGEKISPRYMLVELLTGSVFVLAYMSFGLTTGLAAALVLTSLLIAVAFIDIDTQTIPNGLIIFGLSAGLVFVFAKVSPGSKADYWPNALDALFGSLVGFVPLLLINLGAMLILKKEGMGGGDMKLMAVAGLFLGLKLTIISLIIAIYIGGIAGAFVLLSARIKQRKAQETDTAGSGGEKAETKGYYMAFGPFLAFGSFISMLYGSQLAEWYIKAFLS